VAEIAALVIRPRRGLIEPEAVSAGAYFSAGEIDRARRFSRPQLAIYMARAAVDGAAMVALVRHPPRRLFEGLRRPAVAGAGTGVVLSLALTVAPLPLSAIARQRALAAGLATQSWRGWALDLAKSSAISTALTAAGAAVTVGLMRRLPRSWWAPGSAVVVATGAAFVFLSPVVIDPLFNRFMPLPPGPARDDVLELAGRAGVRVGQVYEVDASRRTTAANAYVTGLGATKRVVLYDTLLKNFSRDETRLVVAHELAHVRHRDVPHGLLYMMVVAPLTGLAVAQLTRRLAGAAPAGDAGPDVLPALALSLALVSTPLSAIANALSRRVEARADAFALRLTHDPDTFISFERRIALRNLIDPDPPRWLTILMGTHPSTVQRIGIARAYEAGGR
jgi:STE24 endopeptidase